MNKNMCVLCGEYAGFVNRVPVCDSYEQKVEAEYSYPEGEWVCAACDQARCAVAAVGRPKTPRAIPTLTDTQL